jgi:hypothetical protein
MPKPFDKNKLRHVLNQWLGEHNGTGGNGDHWRESKESGSRGNREREWSNEQKRQMEGQEKISEIGKTREIPT